MKNYLVAIDNCLEVIQEIDKDFKNNLLKAKEIVNKDLIVLLTSSKYQISVQLQASENAEKELVVIEFDLSRRVDNTDNDSEPGEITYEEEQLQVVGFNCDAEKTPFYLATLLFLKEWLPPNPQSKNAEHMQYTREGMITRVKAERMAKALKEQFHIEWADNIYGNHAVYNERGRKYLIFLRDFASETGYSDSPDAVQNKLGTTKHIMYVFEQLKQNPQIRRNLKKECPFVEIYLNPLNEHRITWFYPHPLPEAVAELIQEYFGENNYLSEDQEKSFLGFMDQVTELEEHVLIRPEVQEKVDSWYEQEMMNWVKDNHDIPFSEVKANLYPYQQKGVSFITYRKGCVLADEMGLGKTLQSITAAIAKKKIFSFRKTLIVCPASLKSQWKKEIEKFSEETATIIGGNYEERQEQYTSAKDHFLITNYEAVLRDFVSINKAGIDFMILDEAQRVKNFETKTWNAISRLERKHILILTGTPIENKLVDIYSLMQLIDPHLLGPLWEFSYQHCLFHPENINKITGYYDLHVVKEKLKPMLLRREKQQVIKELPQVNFMDVFMKLSEEQRDLHNGYKKSLAGILRKKFLTPMDLTRITLLLANMRMVSNSTYLIDDESNYSSKMLELEHILLEKLDVPNNDNKIIIFSEWVKSHKLIGELLRKHNIGFTELNGKVPVKKRGDLIANFEQDPTCKVFLSTEAGGSGLNLQVADTLINFELPWNPAKKNQRIGRIDRIGQKNTNLRVLNFICTDSIESVIAAGISLKQDLFDGVLSSSGSKVVDFSSKGRAQFLQELEQALQDLDDSTAEVIAEELAEEETQELQQPAEQLSLPLVADEEEDAAQEENDTKTEPDHIAATTSKQEAPRPVENPTEKMEEVMNQGMGFLAGLYQMATGQSMGLENQKIEVNKETGEVTMKFKLPGFGN